MRKVLSFITVLLLTLNFYDAGIAQVVTFEPAFATQYDSLVITFDATQGNRELEGFTGEVYLHTGVITNRSTSNGDWKYVPATWTEYPENLKASSLGNNKWQFKYSPNIRDFFGITDESEEVLQVAMLFKGTNTASGNPAFVGRGDGGADIFVELSSGAADARFVQPTDNTQILNSNESLEIVGIGTVSGDSQTLRLLKNDTEISTTTEDSLFYTYTPESGDADVTFDLIVSNGSDLADTASFFATVKENNGELVSRPAGLEDGITYNSDTSVQLSLFAPGKDFVYVIGDFNDWTPSSEYLLNKEVHSADSVWFWTEIEGLTAGEQYGFQYLVDGEIRVADPYAELVLHPNDDQYIPESSFPNLKAYPTNKTDFYVSVLTPGEDEYTWQVTDFEAPASENLVIYELLLRDFLETSNYATLTDTLDYLERLGINAIELMPVNEFDGNLSWGYNPAFHLALDKYYGTKEAFKQFVDEAHSRGIAVILDVVLNHSFGQGSLVRLWNEGEYGEPTADNPYLNTAATHPFNVGYDFNHESTATRYYSKRVMEYWLEEYNVDGFRFDLSKGFTQTNNPNNVGAWGEYDQSRIDIWKDYSSHIWGVNPDAYVILEHFANNDEEQVLIDNGMMVWGNMNHQYNEATMGYPSNLNGVLSENRNFSSRGLVGYMESHDEQWLMFKNISYGACENFPTGGDGCETNPGSYNVRDLSTALDRLELAGAFFLTLPGPKMIWQFGELGYGYGVNGEECLKPSGDGSDGDCPSLAPGRVDQKPIRWHYTDNLWRTQVYRTWANFLSLRHKSPAITSPENSTYVLNGMVKSVLLEHTDGDIMIVGNFDVSGSTQTFDFSQDGTWYDYLNGGTISVNGGEAELTLDAGEYRVFTTVQNDLAVSNEDESVSEAPGSVSLSQNYPNPFNPTTNLQFDLPKAGKVTLEVFDIVGRKVAELVNETKAAGNYTVQFDASNLGSGIYFARLTSGNTIQTRKMILLK